VTFAAPSGAYSFWWAWLPLRSDITAGRLWTRPPLRPRLRLWLLYPHPVSIASERKSQLAQQLALLPPRNFQRDLILRLSVCLSSGDRPGAPGSCARSPMAEESCLGSSRPKGRQAPSFASVGRLFPDSDRRNPLRMKRPQPRGARPAEYRRPDFAAEIVSLSLPP
jgi:hypothetical protein